MRRLLGAAAIGVVLGGAIGGPAFVAGLLLGGPGVGAVLVLVVAALAGWVVRFTTVGHAAVAMLCAVAGATLLLWVGLGGGG